jgi:lysophospholipase L1-like esterase
MSGRRRTAGLVAVGILVAALAVGAAASIRGPSPARTAARQHAGAVTIWPDPVRSAQTAVVEITDPRARATLRYCLTPPGGRTRCRTVAPRTRPGGRTAFGIRAGRLGVWRIELEAAGGLDAVRTFRVAGGPVALLATGDSEIQGIDHMLAAGLPRIRVTSEAHISTGISKPQMFDWVARARVQARALRPDITVVYLGANDGFALPGAAGRPVDCCGAGWIRAFAGRARSMMASYSRGGAGRVYWFTLPAPRDGQAAGVFRAINQAYATAAAPLAGTVALVDIAPVFTPGGRYRDTMVYQGRRVTVREPDGYHLSLAGDQIATSILIGALRADGLLG